METLKVIEAIVPEDSQLVISFVKTKVKEGQITDADTVAQVNRVINSLINSIHQ